MADEIRINANVPNPATARNIAAASGKKNSAAAPLSASSIPAFLVDLVMGTTPAYAADSVLEQPDMSILERFTDPNQTDMTAMTFYSGTEEPKRNLIGMRAGDDISEKTMIGLKVFTERPEHDTVNFNPFKDPSVRRDAFLKKYFTDMQKYPLLYNVNLALSALYVDPQGSALKPSSPMELLKNFQLNCKRNGIWAMIYETTAPGVARTAKYQRIKDDGFLGRQTTRAIVFVYELGQLSVRLGLVKDFNEYLKTFGNPVKFRALVERFKAFVDSNKPAIGYPANFAFSVPQQQEVQEAIGLRFSIYGNVGEAIIKVYGNGENVLPPTLKNIAAQDPNKIMILRRITPADTKSVPNIPGVIESKMIFFACRRPDGTRFYSLPLENFDGTWNPGDPFDNALKEALASATPLAAIDGPVGVRINAMATARMAVIKAMLTGDDLKKAADAGTIQKWTDRLKEIQDSCDSGEITLGYAVYLADKDVVRAIEAKMAEFYVAKIEALKEGLNNLNVRLDALNVAIFDSNKGAIPVDVNNRRYRSANTVKNFTMVLSRITPAKDKVVSALAALRDIPEAATGNAAEVAAKKSAVKVAKVNVQEAVSDLNRIASDPALPADLVTQIRAIVTDLTSNPDIASRAAALTRVNDIERRFSAVLGRVFISDSTTLDKNNVGYNKLTQNLPVDTAYFAIGLAGSEIVNAIDAFGRFEALVASSGLSPEATSAVKGNYSNIRMLFEVKVEELRKALRGRIAAINAELEARKKAQQAPAPVVAAATVPLPVEPQLPPVAFVIGDGDFVSRDESVTVGVNRHKLYYLDFQNIEMLDSVRLSNTIYMAGISSTAYIETNGDIMQTTASVRRFYMAVSAIMANKGKFAELLAEAKKLYDKKKDKIVNNRDAYLAPYNTTVLKALSFEECIMAEIAGRRLSYAGVALAQAFYNTMSDEDKKKGLVTVNNSDILLIGVPTVVLEPLAKYAGLEN